MRVAQPGHEGAAAALDDVRAGGLGGVDGADCGDPVVLDQDVARVGVGAGGVEDGDMRNSTRLARMGMVTPDRWWVRLGGTRVVAVAELSPTPPTTDC